MVTVVVVVYILCRVARCRKDKDLADKKRSKKPTQKGEIKLVENKKEKVNIIKLGETIDRLEKEADAFFTQ